MDMFNLRLIYLKHLENNTSGRFLFGSFSLCMLDDCPFYYQKYGGTYAFKNTILQPLSVSSPERT